MATLLALLVQTGSDELGLTPLDIRNVLYLDYETSPEDMEQRLQALKAGLGLPGEAEVLYRFCSQPLVADIVEIRKVVGLNDIGFIIVDSVGTAAGLGTEGTGGDPAGPVLRYFAGLRSLKKPSLSIDHVSQEQQNKPYGSVYKVNAARNVMQLRSTQDEGAQKLQVGLYQRKNNNGGLFRPMGFEFGFGPGATSVKRIDVMADVVLSKGASHKARMEAELGEGAMTTKELADTLEISEGVIRAEIGRNKARFTRLPDGRIGLAVSS
jgi:hypothetical protein